MYIVTALDGLYMENQAATCSLETARKLFTAWAEKWNMHVESEEGRCAFGDKEVFIEDIFLARASNIVLVVTHKYPECCSIEAYTYPDLALRKYLKTLEHIFKNESDVDNEGNDFIDAIIEIMDAYKMGVSFNDSVWFYNTSVTFRTLRVV
jgi:hypothetical protein